MKRFHFIIALAILVVVCTMLSSCATLLLSKNQKIKVQSVDSTLTFRINDNVETYSAPCTIRVPRSSSAFELHLIDTQTETHQIPSSVSGLCYSNLIGYTSWIGMIVDMYTEKGYKYPRRLLLTHGAVESDKYIDVDARTIRPRERGDVNFFVSWPLVCGSHFASSSIKSQFTNVGIVTTGLEVYTDAKTSLAADYGYNFRSAYRGPSNAEIQTHYLRLQLKYNYQNWSVGGGIHYTYQEYYDYSSEWLDSGMISYHSYNLQTRKLGPSLSLEYHITPGFSMGVDYMPSFTDLTDITNTRYQDYWMVGNMKLIIPAARGSEFRKRF